MVPVAGSRMTVVAQLAGAVGNAQLFTVTWKLPPVTRFFQSISYRLRPILKLAEGSNTIPTVVLVDFSACSCGLPANTPEIWMLFCPVIGSLTCVKKVAMDGEISGRVGARNPRPQFARNSSHGVALNFRPNLGVVASPKSL